MEKKSFSNNRVYPAQMETQSLGGLQVNVTSSRDNRPIPDVTISVALTADPAGNTLEQLTTNEAGRTDTIEVPAPLLEYSQEFSAQQPYSEYTITASAPGFETTIISGTQVLPTVTANQNINLIPSVPDIQGTADVFPIAAHTLYGDYPPKILEAEIKPVNESGEIVLSSVVIPEFIIVHDGPPSDSSATDYWVPYKNYIKNVASSEIYSTWPKSTITANVLAIQSFTLNRVYTEWYRNKGYNFTITSSTAFDHKFIPDRNYFEPIEEVVDEVFTNYLSRPNVLQPILTQYCDGRRVRCPEVMSQWGSNDLGKQGKSAIEILKFYYGDSIYINTSNTVSGVPSSFPGETLAIGSSGESVRQAQQQLNRIAQVYSNIPTIAVDGIYGPATAEAVRTFQKQFNLSQTGEINKATWYKISGIYVAITRIAEYS